MANTADVPSVRALADGTLVAHWLQEDGPDPESYFLPLSWSKDGGQTWSPPATPHHDGTHTQHGFGTLFQAPGGGLGIVWLDGRATASGAPSAGDIGLWSATFDRDAKQTSEMAIEPRACECCRRQWRRRRMGRSSHSGVEARMKPATSTSVASSTAAGRLLRPYTTMAGNRWLPHRRPGGDGESARRRGRLVHRRDR